MSKVKFKFVIMKAKSDPPIKPAVLKAFRILPNNFRGNDIHRLVKMYTGRPFIHTDSSLRKMRQLRWDKKINYIRVGAKDESKYQKIELL